MFMFLQPSRPVSSRPLSRVSTASSGPSAEVLDVLEKLGKLSESHDALTKRVEALEVGKKVIYISCSSPYALCTLYGFVGNKLIDGHNLIKLIKTKLMCLYLGCN